MPLSLIHIFTADRIVDIAPNKGTHTAIVKPTVAEPTPSPSPVPPPDKPKHSAGSDGLPPIIFYAGLGVTVLLAGATTYFMIDTSNKNDAFKSAGCEAANFPDCTKLKDEGETAQDTANIGIAVTAVAGIATAIIGIGLTNWKGPVVAVHPGGGGASWRATF